jgi:predicted aminopeptidase
LMPNLSTLNRLNASQINSNLIRTITSNDVTLFSGSSRRILSSCNTKYMTLVYMIIITSSVRPITWYMLVRGL